MNRCICVVAKSTAKFWFPKQFSVAVTRVLGMVLTGNNIEQPCKELFNKPLKLNFTTYTCKVTLTFRTLTTHLKGPWRQNTSLVCWKDSFILIRVPVLLETSNDWDIEGSKWNSDDSPAISLQPSVRLVATGWSHRQEARRGSCSGARLILSYHFNTNVQFKHT